MKPRLLLIAALAAGPALAAAPLERNLGLGLVYCRVHALPGDLPPVAPAGRHVHPWVLDIRYVSGGAAAGAELLAWLKAEAAPRHPVFLLANPSTGEALLEPLNSPDAVDGLVILGPQAPGFTLPDITVPIAPTVERRAYDALEGGAPIESLLVDPRQKPRDDEAALERGHQSDTGSDSDESDNAPSAAKPPLQPAPLIDLVLLRAVQLDRALLALKRL